MYVLRESVPKIYKVNVIKKIQVNQCDIKIPQNFTTPYTTLMVNKTGIKTRVLIFLDTL